MSGTVKLPANAAAVELVRLRSEDADLAEQERQLQAKRAQNAQLRAMHSQAAEWTEVDDDVAHLPAELRDAIVSERTETDGAESASEVPESA